MLVIKHREYPCAMHLLNTDLLFGTVIKLFVAEQQ